VTVGVTVDGVVTEVELAAVEPRGVRNVAFADAGEGDEPVEAQCGFAPEIIRVFDATAVEGFVFFQGLDVGLCGKLGGRWEDAVFAEERVHVVRAGSCGLLGFGGCGIRHEEDPPNCYSLNKSAGLAHWPDRRKVRYGDVCGQCALLI
jgi:hypothetical protein